MKADQRKNRQTDIFEMLPQAISKFKKNIIEPFFTDTRNSRNANESLPLRAEIYTEEQLEQLAKTIAARHTLSDEEPSEQLLKRLAENESILLEVQSIVTKTVKENNRIVPAAEWLLDNFYLIEEQIYSAKKHLPKGYSKGLPQLSKGVFAGLPRVYDIAVEIISHSDGHVNMQNLSGFVKAYQTITPLKLGELWAIPIMLRLALLENLRRLSIQISIDINNKLTAEHWADQLISVVEKDPKNLVLIIADMARAKPPMESSFVAELTRRLQEKGNTLVLAINWLEQTLSEHGLSSTDLIQQENQKQAADQVSVSNSISSLRFLGTSDWPEFVESTSIVEAILRQDAAGVYPNMDFQTRDHYRHVVEKIAKNSNLTEQGVAEIAIDFAKEEAEKSNDLRTSHVGYFLKGTGLKRTEKLAKMRSSSIESFRKLGNKNPFLIYAGSIFFLIALMCWGLISQAREEGFTEWKLLGISLLLVLTTSQLAIAVVNWLVTILTKPGSLPRMDFSKGIPDEYRTMVVIPTILNSSSGIADLVENMEVHFLANRDVNLSFALLTDFKDAKEKTLTEDEPLLQFISTSVIELNKKYERPGNDTFFLFHRQRQWNKSEKIWMGYERKRGKLSDLNNLLQGEDNGQFSHIIGDIKTYSRIKYVITLDTDTQLPRDAAWQMIATMAHPLNHPVFSEKKKRVKEGYAILQPRVSNSLHINGNSVFSKIHGNQPGTDPYTKAVSDVYQDMFEEGSFIGKGIYDVQAFSKALKNKLPRNRILSHDLLEGAYARAGLLTDVQLYEQYPSSYITDMQRRHRWIRGDWQIASWILPFVSGIDKRIHQNPLSILSKWKIFDNLRRSLVPISLLLLLLFGWIISKNHFFWTLIVLLIIFLPALVNYVWQLCRKPADSVFVQHFIYTSRSLKDNIIQQLIDFVCLPYEAYVNADAIVRTLWRVFITRRNLLQWTPYINYANQNTIVRAYKTMWFAPFMALSIFVFLSIYQPLTLFKILPFLIIWLAAPFITWYISIPYKEKKIDITAEQTIYLRTLARKIWAFFETFVGEEDNWLPPDNYQEQPVERIAHRTSPTNIGMSLLANLTAYDFGYLTAGELIELTTNTLTTLQRMEKYRGHLYNWYDTQTLSPLSPRYVSTVDSGNLVGHLLTLKQGLLSIPGKKIADENMFEGLVDELRILSEKIKMPKLRNFQRELIESYDQHLETPEDLKKYLAQLEQSLTAIFVEIETDAETEADWWIEKIFAHIKNIKNDLSIFIPWLDLPSPPAKFEQLIPTLPGIPTISQLSKIEQILLHKINALFLTDNTEQENDWLTNYRAAITESGRRAKGMILMIEQLGIRCTQLANIDYDFLYDKTQHLLTIGYNVDEHRKDNGYYDLLASEARLTTFVSIAQGKLPQQSWFALGRQLTNVGTTPILLSWSGSMFEYLMPLLIMPAYENTLLDQSTKAVVQKQMDYGRKRGVPWGISESGYNMVDANLNYQYNPFGVPGLGFKRGLGDDLVISPYSTVMSLMVAPHDAYENLQVLKKEGFEGKYGFFEAIDYTRSRLSRKQTRAIVSSFMAHHQGMSLLSISHFLLGRPMQQRFESDVQVKSALLLLQERIPRVTTFYSPSVHESDTSISPVSTGFMRVITYASHHYTRSSIIIQWPVSCDGNQCRWWV